MKPRLPILLALLSLLALSPAPSSALTIVIDDFEGGDFSVTDNTPSAGGAVLGEQSGLAPGTVGGVRLVRVLASGSDPATASLTTTGGDDGALLSGGDASFSFIYDGIANGSSDGTVGALSLDLSVTASPAIKLQLGSGSATVRVSAWDGSPGAKLFNEVAVTSGSTLLSLLGNPFLNLSEIRALRLEFTDVAAGTQVNLIEAVPEPGTAALLALGLAGLAGAKRRRA